MAVDDGASDYSLTPNFHGGAFLRYTAGKMSIQGEVLYSRQGASIKASGENLKALAKYVNVPVLVRYEVVPSFHIDLGPQIGFLTCMKSDYHIVTKEPFAEQHYTKAYKKTDFGVNVGAGYEHNSGLMIDVHYYYGLTDINDYPGLASTKNRVLQISVGYKIFTF